MVKQNRIQQMKVLRFEKHFSLQKIADTYGISRERVRQILGNSGPSYGGFTSSHVDLDLRKQTARELCGLSNYEVAKRLGVSSQTVSNYRGDKRHEISRGTASYSGFVAEEFVSSYLYEKGIPNKLMSLNHSFDILLFNGIKVDVKYCAKIVNNSPSRLKFGSLISPMWRFQIKKDRKNDCDFFICVTKEWEIFVIPFNTIPPKANMIFFCWPTLRPEIGKYQKFKDRFDLLLLPRKGDKNYDF